MYLPAAVWKEDLLQEFVFYRATEEVLIIESNNEFSWLLQSGQAKYHFDVGNIC